MLSHLCLQNQSIGNNGSYNFLENNSLSSGLGYGFEQQNRVSENAVAREIENVILQGERAGSQKDEE